MSPNPNSSIKSIRCALYLRVSTERQVTPEGSLVSQEQRLRHHVESRSLPERPWEVAGVFTDEAKSGGSTDGRTQFHIMMDLVREGQLDLVMCTELARVSRSVRDFILFTDELRANHVEFIALSQSIDTTTGGQAMLNLFASLAELEREWTRARTQANMQARLERGIYNGGPRLFGYMKDKGPGGIKPDPDQAPIVRMIFEEYLNGASLRCLAKMLKGRGVLIPAYTSRRGKNRPSREWRPSHIRRLLRNRHYIAEIRRRAKMQRSRFDSGGVSATIYPMQWEPIIDRSIFDAVQNRLKEKSRGGYTPAKDRDHNYLLSGLLRCSHCNVFLTGSYGRSKKDSVKHLYYRHPNGSQLEDCPLKSYVPAAPLEQMVMDRLDQLVKNRPLMEKLTAGANTDTLQRLSDIKAQISSKEREIRGWDEKLTDMADNIGKLAKGDGAAAVSRRMSELEGYKRGARDDIQRLETELRRTEKLQVNADELAVVVARCQRMMESVPASLKQSLLKLIVSEAALSSGKFTIGIMGEQRWTALLGTALEKGTRSTLKSNTPVLLDWRAELAPRAGFEPATN